MKKFIAGAIFGAALMFTTSVFADGALKQITAYLTPDVSVEIDGKKVALENVPVNYDGYTYLPVRELASAVGLAVDWDDASRTAKLSSGSTIEPTSSNPAVPTPKPIEQYDLKILKDYKPGIDALEYEGIVYVPAADTAKSLGLWYHYNSETRTYTIDNTNVTFQIFELTSRPGDDGFAYNGVGFLRETIFQSALDYLKTH